MKIAILNNLYYPFNRGGAESVVKRMLTNLRDNNHDVFLITTKPKQAARPEFHDFNTYYIDSNYSHLADFGLIRKLFWHFTNLFSAKNPRLIRGIFVNEKPDLIITHNLMGLGFRLPGIIKKLKINHEHYLHDIQLIYPSGLLMLGEEKIASSPVARIYQRFTRSFFGSPDKVISPSHWLLAQHQKLGFFPKSQTLIKRLIELEDLPGKEINNSKPVLKNNFLFVGQIEYHKGILLLIKAFQEALKVNKNLNLNIVGVGRLFNEAQKMSLKNKQIKFLGNLNNQEVNTTMTNSDYLVVPSLCYENSPMTIYEARLNKLAIIAADIGGIPEIIDKSDSLFIPGNSADLAKKILEAI